MRQLLIQVPRPCGQRVIEMAQACQGVNLAQIKATDPDGEIDLILVHISNSRVEPFLGKLEEIPDTQISFFPQGAIALHPPSYEAPDQVTQVEERSPIEIFLSGLQSVGSWRGFLGYAALAGVVVWIGLYTGTIYLLTAAMLIAPFAGPAMNVAIATARGDRKLLGQSLLRYVVALSVTICVAALLSLVLRQQIPTSLMIARSQVSVVAVLLPLTAGAAGALNLVQSERSSLVSGAATGMLVAASLAPPAGIVGMASAIGRWDMALNSAFLLGLQLVGINLSAAILFRVFGLATKGSRYSRGQKLVFPLTLGATVLVLAALLTWQFANPPQLERASRAQRINAQIQQVIQEINAVELIESNVRFPRPRMSGENPLLCVVYVQRSQPTSESADQLRDRITDRIQARILEQGFNVTPLVDVNILELP